MKASTVATGPSRLFFVATAVYVVTVGGGATLLNALEPVPRLTAAVSALVLRRRLS